MRVGEIVRDVREMFAGDVQKIGQIVVAGGENYFFGVVFVERAGFVVCGGDFASGYGECAVVAGDCFDFLILRDFDSVMFGGAAIVFKGFSACGLAADGGHREVADFHALGRGKKNHVGRIVIKRVAEAAFVDDQRIEAGAFGFDGAGEAGGAGADANHVVC